MNCTGNQLAMIRVPDGEHGCEHNGRIFFITDLYAPECWNYLGDFMAEDGERYWAIADRVLRPLDNPDEDAVDETLTWKCGKPPKVDVDAVKRAKQKEKARA